MIECSQNIINHIQHHYLSTLFRTTTRITTQYKIVNTRPKYVK